MGGLLLLRALPPPPLTSHTGFSGLHFCFTFLYFFFLYAFLPFVAIVEATGFGWGFWPESRLVAEGGGVVIPLSSQLASADHYVALLFNSVICPS